LEKFSMKKTLIALAAVAVSSAAMAQVTISGKLRFAYETQSSTKDASTAAAKKSGLRVTDGDLVLTAAEDLGNGVKATADMAIQSRGRDTAIAGRDAKLTLSGGFGSVMIGAIEAGNGIIGLGGAGAPVYGLDGTAIAAAGNTDILRYTTPTMGGLNVYVSALDAPTAGGMEAKAKTQEQYQIGVNFSAGALKVAADYVTAQDNGAGYTTAKNFVLNESGTENTPTDIGSKATTLRDNRTRISASYNLGVAVVGAGYEVDNRKTSATATRKVKDTIIGVSVPMGAITVGLNYGTQDTGDATKPTVKGTDFGVKYDLSKRTYVAAQYQSVKGRDAGSTVTTGAGAKFDKMRIQMAHSF
jgi:predicted porin